MRTTERTRFARAERCEPMSEKAFDEAEDRLRQALLHAQFELQSRGRPAIVLITGMAGGGRGRTTERLLQWLDPRGVEVHASRDPQRAGDRPWPWQWWVRIPPSDRIAVLIDGWVGEAIEARAAGRLGDEAWDHAVTRARSFERHLVDNGMTLVRVWLHLSADQQRREIGRRLRDANEHWHLEPGDILSAGRHDAMLDAAEAWMEGTSSPENPWHIVAAHCPRRRAAEVAELVAARLHEAAERPERERPSPDRPVPAPDNPLARLPLDGRLARKDYARALPEWSRRLRLLSQLMRSEGRSLVVAFEGMDAAGKGGAIQRITDALDPRYFDTHRIAAPTDVERRHPWLWRFWTRVPKASRTAVFDRSWYGRVLVERVEGFCHADDWQRAYGEIREFEEQLRDHGCLVSKFWLHISAEEQLRRFREREEEAHKRHKLTDEDWRNREKAPAYEACAVDMIRETDAPHARWHTIAAEDKLFARIEVMRRLCQDLAGALGISLDDLDAMRNEPS